MKILLVNKFHYRKGGSETYYFTLADALKNRGHEVVFFAMQDEKNNIPCKQDKYFVSNVSMHGNIKSKLNMVLHILYSKEAYRNMGKLLEAENPDLVILNLVHKQITLSIIDAIKEYNYKIPIFWTMHDLIAICPAYTMLDYAGNICEKCSHGNFRPCVKNRCIKGSKLMSRLSKVEADYIRDKKWYDQIDLFICPSDFYRKKLVDAKFTKSDIVTLRNPLPLDTNYELNDHNEDYMLYFGRLTKEKGIKTLIEAAKKTKFRLLVLGTGPLECELQHYAKGVDSIEFKGFLIGEDLERFIKNSRCVILPSEWYENGPYSVMEAMALGKPLIVSDNGGLPELIEDGKNGYIYSAKKGVDALVACIQKMFDLDADEYKRMAAYSLEKARKFFCPNKYVDEIERYYEVARGKYNV